MQFLEIKTTPGLPPNLRRLAGYPAVFAGDQVCSRPRSFSEVRILWGLLARGPVFTCIIRRRRPSQRRDWPFALCAQVIAQDALGARLAGSIPMTSQHDLEKKACPALVPSKRVGVLASDGVKCRYEIFRLPHLLGV
jgi:hypothetical protein